MNSKFCWIGLVALLLSSCRWFQSPDATDVVAEVGTHRLYRAEVSEVTRDAASSQDSVAMADAYIRQWATDILVYDQAKDKASEELESLVEDYRRSLYVHAYEQHLVAHNQPQQWPDSVVEAFYNKHGQTLTLQEDILKGVLLIIPRDAPKRAYLQKWLTKLTEKNVEKIEKYAFQYASAYEYFPTEWRSLNQMALFMPVTAADLKQQISHKSQVVLEDSLSLYVLQVQDKRSAGGPMPQDYARATIEQILLRQWQVQFLQNERNEIYEDALRFNKVKRYDEQ